MLMYSRDHHSIVKPQKKKKKKWERKQKVSP